MLARTYRFFEKLLLDERDHPPVVTSPEPNYSPVVTSFRPPITKTMKLRIIYVLNQFQPVTWTLEDGQISCFGHQSKWGKTKKSRDRWLITSTLTNFDAVVGVTLDSGFLEDFKKNLIVDRSSDHFTRYYFENNAFLYSLMQFTHRYEESILFREFRKKTAASLFLTLQKPTQIGYSGLSIFLSIKDVARLACVNKATRAAAKDPSPSIV